MIDENKNLENNTEDWTSIRHKVLFLFMPESILFENPSAKDDPDFIVLKSITPLFYWCSAHEFVDFDASQRYLFQYQKYSIENNNIVPGELMQNWAKTKYEIKELMMLFLNKWPDHKRVLLNNANGNNLNKIDSFSNFAGIVARSIFNLKNFYIQQTNSSGQNYDVLQKEFWKIMALSSQNNVFYQKKETETDAKKNKIKKNTSKNKKTVNKSIKNN